MDAVIKDVKMGMGSREESGDYLASCMKMTFVRRVGKKTKSNGGIVFELGRRRNLKANAGKTKVMMLSGEEGLESEVCVDVLAVVQWVD